MKRYTIDNYEVKKYTCICGKNSDWYVVMAWHWFITAFSDNFWAHQEKS